MVPCMLLIANNDLEFNCLSKADGFHCLPDKEYGLEKGALWFL